MKHMMRNLTAGLLAAACVPLSGMSASAEVYKNVTSWDVLAQYEPIESSGLFTRIGMKEGDEVFTGTNYLLFVHPSPDAVRFVLRDDAAIETAPLELAKVLDAYFPGIYENMAAKDYETDHWWYYAGNGIRLAQEWTPEENSRIFDLTFENSPENADALEAELLLASARRGLLSEFYGFGETAECRKSWFFQNYKYPESKTDWNAVQTYLDAQHPGYTVTQHPDGLWWINLTPDAPHGYREGIAFACELWDEFGILPAVTLTDKSDAEPEILNGQNALERSGDTNLDCEVDIMDVIAANKHLLGVAQLDKTGMKNADTNGDGAVDSADTLDILKTILS